MEKARLPSDGRVNQKNKVVIGIAIALWMVLGSFLTWLLVDLNRNLLPDVPDIHPSVIFSSFLLLALIIWRASNNSYRTPSAG